MLVIFVACRPMWRPVPGEKSAKRVRMPDSQNGDSRRVLVTGGSGFIGRALIQQLLDGGAGVRVLDLSQPDGIDASQFEFVKGDVRDSERVTEAMAEVDSVVHLAAQAGVPTSIQDPVYDFEVNAKGTLVLLEAARQANVKRFVFASSAAPLGRQLPPAVESKMCLPISPYGASKLAGEGYCLAYNGTWGLGTVVLRFSNVYGPGALHKSSVVAKFMKDILSDGRIVIDGDGSNTRDLIYVGDIVSAICAAIDSDVGGRIYQVGTGTETSIRELAESIIAETGREVKVDFGEKRVGDVVRSYSDITRAREELGWTPQVSLKEGLAATWKWFEVHGAKG